jgi:hypothetical protein
MKGFETIRMKNLKKMSIGDVRIYEIMTPNFQSKRRNSFQPSHIYLN